MFKLDFEIPESPLKINKGSKIFLMGSCFSDEIGKRFSEHKFDVLANPFGTIYNPVSILKGIRNQIAPSSSMTTESQGVFYHWDCHGKISGLAKEELDSSLLKTTESSNHFLRKADVLIITLGTSFVYKLNTTDEIVANCHKTPGTQFSKELLKKEEMLEAFHLTHDYLKEINPAIQVILTISPVRHIKDGLIENNLSKSILIEAVHEAISEFDNFHYFPSYEILIDELRDYRFYDQDMIHPSAPAINYIWKKFIQTHFDEETITFVANWKKMRQAMNHKPFQPDSKTHQDFLNQTLRDLENLNDSIDVSEEIAELKSRIS